MTHTTLPKPTQSNQQVQEYLSAVDKGIAGRFVVQYGKGWYVRKPHDTTGMLFATKQAAIDKATQELNHSKGELFIFDDKGNLLDRK